MADNVKPMSDRAKEAVAGAVEKTKHVVDDGLDNARDKFEEVVDELDGRYRKAASEVKRSAERMGEVAREKYQVAAQGAREGYVKVRKDLDRVGADVSEYVRENPGKSLLMAAGVGFVIGLLLRRPGRDEV